jgi:hypothetical protein
VEVKKWCLKKTGKKRKTWKKTRTGKKKSGKDE